MNEKRLCVSLALTIALVLVTGVLTLVWLVSGLNATIRSRSGTMCRWPT